MVAISARKVKSIEMNIAPFIATRTPEVMYAYQSADLHITLQRDRDSSAFPDNLALLHAPPWLRSASCVRARVSLMCWVLFQFQVKTHDGDLARDVAKGGGGRRSGEFIFCDHFALSIATITNSIRLEENWSPWENMSRATVMRSCQRHRHPASYVLPYFRVCL